MFEPRGHDIMSGAIIYPGTASMPTRPPKRRQPAKCRRPEQPHRLGIRAGSRVVRVTYLPSAVDRRPFCVPGPRFLELSGHQAGMPQELVSLIGERDPLEAPREEVAPICASSARTLSVMADWEMLSCQRPGGGGLVIDQG